MTDNPMTWSSLAPAMPEICLVIAICAILLIDVFAGEKRRGLTSTLTLLAIAPTRKFPSLLCRRQRLQISLADSNMCEEAEYLRFGTAMLGITPASACAARSS